MLTPLSWLKDYVDIDITPHELEEKLFSCGFEVEELYEVGKDISKVVVGHVLTCEAIPDTHLHVCQVDCGEHGQFQICCGADNVRTAFCITGMSFDREAAHTVFIPPYLHGCHQPIEVISTLVYC